MIEIRNVSYSYRDGEKRINALRNINLDIRQGEWVSITGMNGSGKSTLSRLFNGLLVPTEGTVHVGGLQLKDSDNLRIIKQKLQVVFQNPDAQTVGSTLVEDIAFGLESRGLTRYEIKYRIEAALKKVDLTHKLLEEVSSLSGGQRQRLAIASCLALEPEYLVFDESTSMLDPMGRKEIYKLARSLWRKGITVIWITQRLEEVATAGRVVILEQGSIRFDGTATELFYESSLPLEYRWDPPAVIRIGLLLKEQGIALEDLPLEEEELDNFACELNLQT